MLWDPRVGPLSPPGTESGLLGGSNEQQWKGDFRPHVLARHSRGRDSPCTSAWMRIAHACLQPQSRSLILSATVFGKMAHPVRHTVTLQHLPAPFSELFMLLPLFSSLYLWNLESRLLWETALHPREPLGPPPHGLGVHRSLPGTDTFTLSILQV